MRLTAAGSRFKDGGIRHLGGWSSALWAWGPWGGLRYPDCRHLVEGGLSVSGGCYLFGCVRVFIPWVFALLGKVMGCW